MVIARAPIDLSDYSFAKTEDEALRELIQEIINYLESSQKPRYFLSIGKRQHYRYYKSWDHIYSLLNKFITNPKVHYTPMVRAIELEIKKFPANSTYSSKLLKLKKLISQGPMFRNYHRQI